MIIAWFIKIKMCLDSNSYKEHVTVPSMGLKIKMMREYKKK